MIGEKGREKRGGSPKEEGIGRNSIPLYFSFQLVGKAQRGSRTRETERTQSKEHGMFIILY